MEILMWLVVILGLPTTCLQLFEYLEKRNSSRVKNRALDWLSNAIPIRVGENSGSIFIDIFDEIFGKRFISLRFALMSVISSLAFVILLTCIWAALYPIESKHFIENPFSTIILFGLILSVTNLIPDFFSNCQTRCVLGIMVDSLASERSSIIYVVSKWLAIDFLFTVLISALVVIPASLFATEIIASSGVFVTIEIPKSFDLTKFLTLHATEMHVYTPDDGSSGYHTSFTPSYGVFFYSTFFTSIWMWMFSLSGMIVRLAHNALGPDSPIIEWFGFKHYPLKAQGEVCAIVLAAVCIVTFIVTYFFPNST